MKALHKNTGTSYIGWPVGFGDDDRAKTCLRKALVINPGGIDANYFYGDFLLDQGEYVEARKFLLKARQAPQRSQRPLADRGRQDEIKRKLARLNEQLAVKADSDHFFN
jgi:Tfp pilus assembly protein PilF